MSGENSVQPHGDKMRKAIKWISEMHLEHPEKSREKIIREVQIRFDLSPKECEFLESNFS